MASPISRATGDSSGICSLYFARADWCPEVTLPSTHGAPSMRARISVTWADVRTWDSCRSMPGAAATPLVEVVAQRHRSGAWHAGKHTVGIVVVAPEVIGLVTEVISIQPDFVLLLHVGDGRIDDHVVRYLRSGLIRVRQPRAALPAQATADFPAAAQPVDGPDVALDIGHAERRLADGAGHARDDLPIH